MSPRLTLASARPLALLAVLLAAATAIAQQAPLKGWTYTCNARPLGDEWADPHGTKLNDGDKDPAHSYIVDGGTIPVEISLPAVTKLSKLVAYVHRHNDNYKLRKITVEALQAGQWTQVGENTSGFWGPTQQVDFALAVPLDVTTDKLRLTFFANSIVSIQEVELFGEAAPAAAAGGYRLPLNNAPGAHVSTVDAGGKKVVVLENPLVRLIFQPDGGVCRSMVVKPSGAELVGGDGRYGLLRDQLWSPDYAFADRLYFATTGNDQDGAWVELAAQGVGGMMSFTSITKRVSITPDSPVVRVHYSLKNDPNSQTDYTYGFWVHSFLGVAGQNATYFFPTTGGIVEQRFQSGKELETWQRDPARGWVAYIGDDGIGLAATMEYRYLNCFYMWSGTGTPIPTLEWRYNRIPLKAGQTFQTDIRLIPFQGLKRVDGVVGDVIGAIETDPATPLQAHIELYRPPGSKRAEAVASSGAANAQAPGRVQRLTIADTTASLDMSLLTGNQTPAPTMLTCTVTQGDQKGSFGRVFGPNGEAVAQKIEPLEKRVGDSGPATETTQPGHELSTAVETLHVKWAKPYYRGPIRALVLCDDRYCREIIELWQRLDMQFDYVKFLSTYEKEWLYQGDRSILTLDAAQKRLEEKLKGNYEVIILSGLRWDFHFTPKLREAIATKVQAGCGLVYIEPDGLSAGDELQGVCGAPDGQKRSLGWWGKWSQTAEHYVTSGLPWQVFPSTRRMPMTTPPPGQTLATIGGAGGAQGADEQPLIVAGQLGNGRVLTLTYDTLTHDPGYRGYSALTPALGYRGAYCQHDEMAKVTWQYWEHYFALLARCAVWAAGKDSGVEFRDLAADVRGKILTGRIVGQVPAGASIDITFRDRYSNELAQARAVQRPGEGAVSLSAALPDNLRAGRCFADLIMRDAKGASVAWASTVFDGSPIAALKGISVEKRTVTDTQALWTEGQPWVQAFRANVPLKLTCAVEPVLPLKEPLTLTAVLSDCHGRVVFEESKPVAGSGDVTFAASPPVLYNMGLRWDVTLRSGTQVCDTARADLLVIPPREFDRFTLTSWSGQYLWRCDYLFDTVRRQVEDLGLDVAMNGITELGTGTVWGDYWQNINHSYLGILSYMGPGVPDFVDSGFAEKAAAYAKTKDKKYLLRDPCLSDPVYLQKMTDALRGNVMGQIAEYGRAYDYCMGDEMSLSYYTQYFDFDFSPASLAAFRKWLQARYPSLDALNAVWQTRFTDWDGVMPMTLDEVTGRANAAPWAEFRVFMNHVLADYFALVQRTIREKDPQARCGLSGTQEPKPGNGMDWWLLSQAFSYFHSYNTGWSDEMRRSFQPCTGVAASPYRCGYWQSGEGLEYQMFWCLLHDTKGISAWMTPLFFYGDLTLSEAGADTRANTHELKAGIWDAIRAAQRRHDGIAIHYSQPSINGALLMNKDEEIAKVRDAWVTLIEDLGLQYNFVSYAQVEDGILTRPKDDAERYKVLILPESIALSPQEVAQIKQFVQDGGTVIGDQSVGLMDDKCRRLATGSLDSLFGITRSGAEKPLPLGVSVQGVSDMIRLPAGESALRAAGAAVRGQVPGTDVPAVLENKAGRGRAVYLNLNLAEFDNERTLSTPTEKAVRQTLLGVLAPSGVKPPYPVALASGKAPHVEVVRYAAGPLEYVGLLRVSSDEGADIVTVDLGRPRQVYDVRAGKPLGKLSHITVPMQPGECRVYCLSAAPLGRVSASAATTVVSGGQVRYRVALGPGNVGERQLVQVRLIRPDGREAHDYARNVLLATTPFEGTVQLALNDPAGTWKLRARSLCTGQTAEATFQVGGR